MSICISRHRAKLRFEVNYNDNPLYAILQAVSKEINAVYLGLGLRGVIIVRTFYNTISTKINKYSNI